MQKFNTNNNSSKEYSVSQYLTFLKKNTQFVDENNKDDKNLELGTEQIQTDRTRKVFDKIMQGKFENQASDPMIIKSLGFTTDEGFLNNYQGGYKTITTQKKSELVAMSNAQIKKIIDNKLYQSVQISLRSKNVLLKANKSLSQKIKQKKNISKMLPEEKETPNFNVPGLKLPEINKKMEQNADYNSLNNEGLLQNSKGEEQKKMPEEQKKIDRHFSQDITQKKQNIFRKRSQQNDKMIQTFYEYEKIIQKKQQQALKQWRERNNKDKTKQKFLFINYEDHKIPAKKENIDSQPLLIVEHQKQQKTNNTIPTRQQITAISQQRNQKNATTLLFKNKKKKNIQTPIIIKQLIVKETTVYSKKISAYRDFIFLINFAHGRFDPLILKDDPTLNRHDLKYKAYVGKGNNSLLLKSLLKRRYWWTLEEDPKNSNFAWTQLKINSFFQDQKTSTVEPQELQNFINTSKSNLFKVNTQKTLKKDHSRDEFNQKSRQKLIKPIVPEGLSKILCDSDEAIYQKYATLNLDSLKMEDYQQRVKYLEKKLIPILPESRSKYKVHNHLQCNYFIGNKKALFYNLRQYYQLTNKNVFDYLPLTFHIKKGIEDIEYKNFVLYYKKKELAIKNKEEQEEEKSKKKKKKAVKNIWIVKPGQNSNRGNGITVINQIYQLNKILKKRQKHHNGIERTYIVQAYIDKPLLYHKRKFDIRHYMLITTLYGKMKGYWYRQGYIRTSAYQFDLDDLSNSLIHLTNDAIQKHGHNYGKYEDGNKISYLDFQKYLDHNLPQKKYDFYGTVYPKMKNIARDAIRGSYLRLDPKKLQHNFQIFGLDFMIDDRFNVWLIEINTNPCLQISSGLLGRIIPTMVQHSFRLSLDILFPPYAHYPNTQKHLAPQSALESLKYQLIFDQQTQGVQLQQLYQNKPKLDCGEIDEQEQIYLDEGKEFEQDVIL